MDMYLRIFDDLKRGEGDNATVGLTAPRYQDIPASAIPEVTDDDGTHVRVISGEFWGKKGPVEGVAADPHYVDVSVAPGRRRRLKVDITRNAFAYVFAGTGTFRDASPPQAVLTEQATDPHAEAVYDIGKPLAGAVRPGR
jgi:quercetin 2,3-dioxygenase